MLYYRTFRPPTLIQSLTSVSNKGQKKNILVLLVKQFIVCFSNDFNSFKKAGCRFLCLPSNFIHHLTKNVSLYSILKRYFLIYILIISQG